MLLVLVVVRQWRECDPPPPGGSRTRTLRSCCRGLPSGISASWCRCRIIVLIAASTRLISRPGAFYPDTPPPGDFWGEAALQNTHTSEHTHTKCPVIFFFSFFLILFLFLGSFSSCRGFLHTPHWGWFHWKKLHKLQICLKICTARAREKRFLNEQGCKIALD